MWKKETQVNLLSRGPITNLFYFSWPPGHINATYLARNVCSLSVTAALWMKSVPGQFTNFLKAFINKTGIKVTVLDKIYLFAKMSFFFIEAISFWQLWFWVYAFFFFISMTYVKMTLINNQIWWPVSESMSHTKTNKCWHSYQSQASSNLILLHNNTNP